MAATLRLRMDLQLFSGEKTEAATPKKLQDARKKGQVAKSMDLSAAFILFFSFLTFYLFGGFMKEHLIGLIRSIFSDYLLMNLSIDSVMVLVEKVVVELLFILGPILGATMLMAVVSNYMQIGFLLTGDGLKVKFSKINPLEGVKKLFSPRAAVDFVKSVLKMTIIGIVVYNTLMNERSNIMQLAHLPLEEIVLYASSVTMMLGLKIGGILIALALFDYMYQRYDHAKSLRMSKQDIKDEYKKTEGDPHIKGKIREKQRRMAMQRMMQDVPKADVIITNPTHFAVAIQYDSSKMGAPTVVAKGTDFMALKIREKAKEHGVMIMENRPLARALYAQVEIGEPIPGDMFQAVAEVLAYVYKMKGKAN
ncbi:MULTISPECIES: flagellar biosynthesis protein FlhB [Paenibacillus]|uniref:flagellar biosynthesis protein FlhB n=1 Tax=Paenibacillus TaxID=44249 RepID=UPI0022B87E3A|nr:flagellar biosynthesis protein FlhB [Paenibacillus caseinilyticus]MCZ8520039.1 flagellar biosynthesis protein FlhB [Paenibacillus caseinilyticus]